MTERIARLAFPCALGTGVAILAKSYAGVGDGFSAGAVAGLGAVVQFVCLDHQRAAAIVGARWARRLLVGGLLLALAVAVGPSLLGTAPVTHAPGPGDHVVRLGAVEIHTALLFDLGTAVCVYGALVGTFHHLVPPLRGDEP